MLFCLALLASATLLIPSCKKGTPVDIPVLPEPEPQSTWKTDSVSYQIGNQVFAGLPDFSGLSSIMNGGYRMKYFDKPDAGMKAYRTFGSTGRGWYSPIDSIYFACGTYFRINGSNEFKIAFAKGFHTKDMKKYGSFYFPADTRKMLPKGRLTFATDFENTNAKEGVAISVGAFGRTGMPESAFENSVDKYSQEDAMFEILKTEQIDEDHYRVEAIFEINLYDAGGNKNRLKNGYIRFTVQKTWWGGYFYNGS